jgi:hypothetical protein
MRWTRLAGPLSQPMRSPFGPGTGAVNTGGLQHGQHGRLAHGGAGQDC